MACFLVSAAEAAVVTVAEKRSERMEAANVSEEAAAHIPLSRKLRWLARLLWGGGILLAFEHVWHGEVVPWFPFLSAMSDPADAAEMFHEMATTGVCMALLVTAVWVVMCVVADRIASREDAAPETSEAAS